MIPIYNNSDIILTKLNLRNSTDNDDYVKIVKDIIDDVIKNKDEALIRYSRKFDCPNMNSLVVSDQELKEAYDSLDSNMKEALATAKERIIDFHKKQIRNSWSDGCLGQIINPIEKVGIYVPGGTASYFSTVLMTVLPAIVAGVKNIIITSPVNKEGIIKKEILASAYLCGVKKVYKVGGAQAIAAMAYGTQTISKVDKIVGPGNIYVALAKKEVFGQVGIDSFAGPSEILIIADELANPKYIAADLLSQAEHDVLSSAILITTSKKLANKVQKQCLEYTKTLLRKDIIDNSLKNYSGILLVETIDEAINIANDIAPEHLELIITNANDYQNKIKNAGAIFIGQFSPEALGDYLAGPSHVLPTNKTARFSSPLGVDDFIKKTSTLFFDEKTFKKLAEKVICFAEAEGLDAHALAIKVRMDKND